MNDLADVGEKIDDAYEAVRILQVRTSMDSNKDGLWDHRPMFTVNFPNLQNDDIKVSVYVDVPKEVQQYMSVTNVQPVSFGTGILLSKDTAKEKCDFNSEKNQFELPLDLRGILMRFVNSKLIYQFRSISGWCMKGTGLRIHFQSKSP